MVKKLAALRADKKLIKSDVIGLIDKKKATKSISSKIIQIGKDEVIRKKAFDKAQKQLWESTATSRKKITDLTSKRDVEFLEKLWKAKGLTEKTAQVLLSASVRPLMGAGIGWSLGALWGPEDTNLGTWMMVGASLGATHKAIQASKILPGQSKNLLQRIIYRDATKLSFQKARELTSTTTSSKSSAGVLTTSSNIVSGGTITGGGLLTTGGNVVIPDAGTIGSASDTNAIAISSAGVITISTNTDSSNSTTGALVAHSAGFADDVNIGDQLNVGGAIAGSSRYNNNCNYSFCTRCFRWCSFRYDCFRV